MKTEHYKLIIEKTIQFKGKIDGDDLYDICRLIDDLLIVEISSNQSLSLDSNLIEELYNIANAMWCEHGMDYGSTRNWDNTALNIVEAFKTGYVKNEENLDKLLAIINSDII